MANKPDIQKWQSLAQKELRDRKLDDLAKTSDAGLKVKPLYTSDDVGNTDDGYSALPGIEPYTRGPKATMYTGRPWTIRQYAGFSTAEESMLFTARR